MASAVTNRLTGLGGDVAMKAPVLCASTANLTISSTQVIDGVSVSSGARILIKDQDDATENGIYIVGPSAWDRATDCDGARDLVIGTLVYVTTGSTANTNFERFFIFGSTSSTSNIITPGTDAITIAVSQALTAVVTVSTDITVSSFAETLLDDSSAVDMRATLSAQQDVITTLGDLVTGSTAGVAQRLALGSTATVLGSDSSKVAYVKVDLGRMSTGTPGNLITYSSLGVPAAVVTGSADQVLTSKGAGLPPTFQSVGGGAAALVLLATVTSSGAASADFNAQLGSTYDRFLLIGIDINPSSDDVDLWIRTDSDSGASYDAGASDYAWLVDGIRESGGNVDVMDSVDNADNQIVVNGSAANRGMGSAAAECGMLTLWINNPSGAIYNKSMHWKFSCQGTGGAGEFKAFDGMGARLATAAIDSIQLKMSSGNMDGVFRLYGVVNS